MAHLEAFNPARELASLFEQGAQDGTGDLVLALHLLDHQLRVADDPQLLDAVLDSPAQNPQEPGIFGKVIGLDAQEFAQFGNGLALGVLNDGTIAGGAGVAPGTSIAVGGKPGGGRLGGGGVCKEIHRFLVYRGQSGCERTKTLRKAGLLTLVAFFRLLYCG